MIRVKNEGSGKVALTVNGKPVAGTLVPYAKAGETVQVECSV